MVEFKGSKMIRFEMPPEIIVFRFVVSKLEFLQLGFLKPRPVDL